MSGFVLRSGDVENAWFEVWMPLRGDVSWDLSNDDSVVLNRSLKCIKYPRFRHRWCY